LLRPTPDEEDAVNTLNEYTNLGELAERRGDLTLALAEYTNASLLDEHRESFLRLARVHFKKREWSACLHAFDLAATKPAGPGPELLGDAAVFATAAMYELGYLDLARTNCPTLRALHPQDPYVERLCKIIDSPFSSPDDPLGCGRVCFSLYWRAPWETSVTPTPRTACTRQHLEPDLLYQPTPVSFAHDTSTRHPLVLLTAPRPVPTLPATLESLRAGNVYEWPSTMLLVSDGPLELKYLESGWRTDTSPSRTGSAKTFVRALRRALELCPDLKLLTIMEDDVEVCRNFFDYLRLVKVPDDLALVTWFTCEFPGEERMHEEASRRGWRHPSSYDFPVLARRSTQSFVLFQCATLTRDTVERLLRCPRVLDWHQENGHDEMPAWALGDVPYAAHFPGLVQHTGGLCSAVAANRTSTPRGRDPQAGERTSPYYVGPDFDALSLVPRGLTLP
jgi:hypothetical protein